MDEERIIEALREELSAARRLGDAAVGSFLAGLARRDADGTALVEFALRTMEGFAAADGFLVADGCRRLLFALGGPAQATRVRAFLPSLPSVAGPFEGIARDYRPDYYELVAVLEGRGQGVCDCRLRARFGPPPEEAFYETLRQSPHPDVTGCLYDVRCRSCGMDWVVEADFSYHYPHCRWTTDRADA